MVKYSPPPVLSEPLDCGQPQDGLAQTWLDFVAGFDPGLGRAGKRDKASGAVIGDWLAQFLGERPLRKLSGNLVDDAQAFEIAVIDLGIFMPGQFEAE